MSGKGRRLAEAGKDFRVACSSDSCGTKKKGGWVERVTRTLQHSSKWPQPGLKRVCKPKSPRRSPAPYRWAYQQQGSAHTMEESEGGSGTIHQLYSPEQIQVVRSWPSCNPIPLSHIYHISNLPTIIERPMCIQSTTLKYSDWGGKIERIKKSLKSSKQDEVNWNQ